MKKTLSTLLLIVTALIFSLNLHAEFSPDLISHLETYDNEVLSKGKTLDEKDIHDIWKRFDDDVLKALNALDPKMNQKAANDALNKAFHWKKIVHILTRGEEMDEIELGAIQVKFYPLGKNEWLAEYYHGVGIYPTSTFHVFKKDKKKTTYELKDTMEDLLPKREDMASLEKTTIQIQFIPKSPQSITTRFSTIHQPPARGSRTNRSQIVWEKSRKKLKPIYWFPQVDWHTVEDKTVEGKTVEGKLVEGRGPGEPL